MTQADCIIIGGGIVGLTTALRLADAGMKVTVLDRQHIGREASWAGGGILCPLYAWHYPEPVQRMALRGMQLYAEFAARLEQETPVDPEYQQPGMLILDPMQAAGDEERIDRWLALGQIEARHAPAQEILPELDERQALWLPQIASVRNPRLLKSLVALLQQRGVTLREQAEVTGLETANGRVTGVRLAGETLAADYVVAAAGAWSGGLIPGLTPADVFPVRGQMLRLAGRAPRGVPTILMEEGIYLIPRRDGGVIVGSTVEHVGFDKHPTEETLHRLHRKAIALWPDLDHAPITHRWSGLRPGSRDELPFIGAHPELAGLYLNTGHYRNGLAMAPATAEMLTELMLGQEPTLDPTPFRVDRPRA